MANSVGTEQAADRLHPFELFAAALAPCDMSLDQRRIGGIEFTIDRPPSSSS
jgi:hypothetical protein